MITSAIGVCTAVLHSEQDHLRLWFLHELSGNANLFEAEPEPIMSGCKNVDFCCRVAQCG